MPMPTGNNAIAYALMGKQPKPHHSNPMPAPVTPGAQPGVMGGHENRLITDLGQGRQHRTAQQWGSFNTTPMPTDMTWGGFKSAWAGRPRGMMG